MPTIVVNDPSNVLIDGVASGAITDVIANHGKDKDGKPIEAFHSAVLDALKAHVNGIRQKHADDLKAAKDEHKAALDAVSKTHADDLKTEADKYATALAAHKAAQKEAEANHKAEIEHHARRIADLQTQAKEQQALIDTLGGTDLGKKLAREARRRALIAAKAQADAELAAIDGAATSTGA